MPKYHATEHWAKIELDTLLPRDLQRLAARYPVQAFNVARNKLDPKNILANEVVDRVFPRA